MRGHILDIDKDIFTNKFNVILSVDDIGNLEELKEKDLDIDIHTHREKRSLNANAYFHVLSGKIAEKLTISKARSKNILICKYGQPEMVGNEPMVYKTNAPVEYMQELETIHTIPVKYDGDVTFYRVYRGSHTYNSSEMNRLIEGTIADAKELGIETISPTELQRMVSMWKA